MGWEWRIFVPGNESSVISLLSSLNPESRTDVYHHLGHAALGLKDRAGKRRELKVRRETLHCWERWDKWTVSNDTGNDIMRICGEIQRPDLMEHAKKYMSSNPVLPQVTMQKQRIQDYGNYRGAVLEQTDLKVYLGETFVGSFRSFAVDAATPDSKLPEFILQRVGPDVIEKSIVGGYPAFVAHLVESGNAPAI